MMIEKSVFIVIVNYNGWKDTIEAVKSLQCIDGINITVVVVDNQSTDDSIVILKRTLGESIVLIEAPENKGFSYGNNIGIQYAMKNHADFVLLLNNDTVVDEDFITPLVHFAETEPKCGCISPRIYYNDDRNMIWYDGGSFQSFFCKADHLRFNERGSTVSGIQKTKFVSGCCMLLPVRMIETVGLMDERYFLYVEDTEYCLRMMRHGYALYWDADCHIYHKVSASTGKISDLAQYYSIRNRLLLGETYLNGFQKFTTGLYNIVFYLYKLARGRFQLKMVIRAYKDFNGGKFGKTF